ncbi:hypothetical protein COO20_15105 [Thalassospira marina]|uniref:Uncharacterized protein n=1 Tax=Thalassospira marina TaxID=2048283 RepID=A0A2N3KSE6_9PROT|nr:hypothetical protein COO20_15105 [Thalassospira marina]
MQGLERLHINVRDLSGPLEHVAFNLHHFARDSLRSHMERFAEHSGGTVKDPDAVERKTVLARRV